MENPVTVFFKSLSEGILSFLLEREGRNECRERHIDWLSLVSTHTEKQTRNLGMCLDQKVTDP